MRRLVLLMLSGLAACAAPAADASRRDTAHKSVSPGDSMMNRIVDIDGVATDTADGDWIISTQKSEMDDAVTTLIALRSDHPFAAEKKQLVVQCEHGKPWLFFYSGGPVESASEGMGTDVRYRSDDGTPVSSRWLELSNYRGIFPKNSAVVIKQIAAAKRWRIEYTPFKQGPVTTSFRPAGLKAALAKVATACHWQ
jgi:hypothetical protein